MLSVAPAVVLAATSSSSKSGGSTIFLYLIPVALVLLFVSRNNRKRQQAVVNDTMQAIEPGKRVLTASGQFGTVVKIDDGVVDLEVADGVVVQYVIGAIARVVTPPEEIPAEEPGPTAVFNDSDVPHPDNPPGAIEP